MTTQGWMSQRRLSKKSTKKTLGQLVDRYGDHNKEFMILILILILIFILMLILILILILMLRDQKF